ncbi:MAG: GNAT family N-acetyltransferase [Ignavibacteria bacterium]|nr:GNAT family N-acetyltransferase [Ignavibacteria bacterium]
MNTVEFEPLSETHRKEIMEIYNYYAENSFAAYPEKRLPDEFYNRFLDMTKGYPAYAITVNKTIAGFCFIRPYNPFPAFKETAEITYFLHKDFSGMGLGKIALDKLEEDAVKMGVKILLASITSENRNSLRFHEKNGFTVCGNFTGIAKKFGKQIDIVWMEKKIL